MSYEWHIGQKIVCIDNHTDMNMLGTFFIKNLVVGKIYIIEDIKMSTYDDFADSKEEYVSFTLSGVNTRYADHYKNAVEDRNGFTHYYFYHARFKPLEEKSTDISIFNSLLKDVNDGKVRFDDEEIEKHMKPKRQVEFT